MKCIFLGSWQNKTIEWKVLDQDSDRIFLFCNCPLLIKSYNYDISGGAQWETSDIRKYLNNDFYNKAFSADEKRLILDTDVIHSPNEENKIGNKFDWTMRNEYKSTEITKDKLFLLSLSEVDKYLSYKINGEISFNYNDNFENCYFLRSPDFNCEDSVFAVSKEGDFVASKVNQKLYTLIVKVVVSNFRNFFLQFN